MTAETVHVLIVDDHDVVRQGLTLLIEKVLAYEVSQASDAMAALASVRDNPPDVVLLDARMPERDGIWTLRELKKLAPDLPVIMLSTYDSEEYVEPALEEGASGYLLKDSASAQLGEAITTALAGEGTYLHPAVAQRLIARRHTHNGPGHTLSTRELEILQLVAGGETNDAIANQLHVSEKTVKAHLTSIFRKLDVVNRTQAAMKAVSEGLVSDHKRD